MNIDVSFKKDNLNIGAQIEQENKSFAVDFSENKTGFDIKSGDEGSTFLAELSKAVHQLQAEFNEKIIVIGQYTDNPIVVKLQQVDEGVLITVTDKTSSQHGVIRNGESGEGGGHYKPNVTQLNDTTIEISFTPSKDGMELVEPTVINLPSSNVVGDYVTVEELEQKGFAKKSDIPTDYIKEIPPEYVTEDELSAKGYAHKSEIPTDYITDDELLAKGYAVKEDIPVIPQWAMQPQKPAYNATEVGSDQSGTAESKVSEHNVSTDAHNDIRVFLSELTNRLNALADSDDTTLDQMSEIVAYIKSNKSLIESVTTEKVSYTDIIDNLVTNLPGKPLSAAQGVALKALIDAIKVPTKVSELNNDKGYLTEHQSLADYALKAEIPIVPKNVSAFSNDAGYLTQHQDISGKLDADKLPEAINYALAQAKESGEFEGEDGVSPIISVSDIEGGHRITVTDVEGAKTLDVMDGANGYTPQKGVDYFTAADKGQIVNEVLTGLPTGTVSNAVTLTTAQTITGVKTFTASNFFDGEQKLTFGQYCPTVTDIASGIGASMKNARAVDCQLYVAEVYAPYWGADITHGGKEPTSGLTASVGQIDFYVVTGSASGQPTGRKLIMQMKEDGLYVLGKKVKTE